MPRSTRRSRAIQTPKTSARTITSTVATSAMLSVIIASCHRSKNQMPARQTTVDTSARTPPNTKASATIASDGEHHGDSASSDCIGLSSQLVTTSLIAAR